MDSNQDNTKPPVKLLGFAPASGSGAASFMSGPSAASASSVSSVAGAGGGADATAPPAKKPSATVVAAAAAKAKRANARKKLHKSNAMSSAATPRASEANGNDDDAEETILCPLSDVGSDFAPLSLPQIQLRLKSLLEKLPKALPSVPPSYVANESAAVLQHAPIKAFASKLQVAIEEYNLLLSLVSCATYKWGVDRSGASQQNLSVMSAELQQCQDVITNVVSARLSNVLCPAVDVVIGEVEIVREGGKGGRGGGGDSASAGLTPAKKRKLNEDKLSDSLNNNERRINHFKRPVVDPSYVHLCHCILARNAPLIRHTVATSIHTAQKVIGDYSKAMKKDSSHDSGKGGYY